MTVCHSAARRCHHGHARNSCPVRRASSPGTLAPRTRPAAQPPITGAAAPSQEVTCPALARVTPGHPPRRGARGRIPILRQVFSDLDWLPLSPAKRLLTKPCQNIGGTFREISYRNTSARCFGRDMLTERRGGGLSLRHSLWQGTGSSHEHGRPLHEQRDWAPRHVKAGSAAPSAIRPVPGMRRPACRHGRRRCDRSRRACQQSRGGPPAWAAFAPATRRRDSVRRLPDLPGGPPGLRRLVRALQRQRDRRRSRLLMPRRPGAGPATSRVTAPGDGRFPGAARGQGGPA